MKHARLTLAHDDGLFVLPEGQITVYGARAGDDLSLLPKDRTVLVTGFYPDHAAWTQRGYQVATQASGTSAMSIVLLPRSKQLARGWIAQAAQLTTDTVIVDGQKTDGIDGVFKHLRKLATTSAAFSKAHGKLFTFVPAPDLLADWALPERPRQIKGGFVTRPGVFSADGVDPASALLARHIPAKPGAYLGDLGGGWGYLTAQLLKHEGVKSVDLVEADHEALACARLNVKDERVKFHWADATRWRADRLLDGVVMNPPFHTSRQADPELGQAFVAAAAAALAPGGRLWMVANRHLPYEGALETHFAEFSEIAGDNRFKILTATRASRQRR